MRAQLIKLLIALLIASSPVMAEETTPAITEQPKDPAVPAPEPNRELLGEVALSQPIENKTWQFAVGLGSIWSVRHDYGARSFQRSEPEIIGFYYTMLPSAKLWLRHGARLGYSNDQPQMPQSVRMEESDIKLAVDESLVWSGVLAPAVSLGIGYDWREIKSKKLAPVLSRDDRLDTKQGFVWYYAQAGLGIPALAGEYMLEPVLRWQHLPIDRRTTWAFGFEMTKAW